MVIYMNEYATLEEIIPLRKINNTLDAAFLVILNLICFALNYSIKGFHLLLPSMEIQIFAIFAGIFIYFYNGQRGYNALWWKYGCYLYYPIHVAIIYMIYLLL